MAVNKRKVLENARKFVQKGATEKALAEYQRLLKLDPRDSKIRLEIGDAYRRWGKVEEAVDAYLKVANQYMSEGFDARAVAVFKQILNLDPACYSAYEPLADLYQRMGLNAESIQSLQVAADGYHKQGRKQDALALLRKMAMLDPTNTSSRIKVADLLKQEGMSGEALAEYDEALAELQRHGDREAVEIVYKRILEVDPRRVATLQQYARSLLEMARPAEAESVAKRALDADPGEIQNFELLADVYRTTKDTDAITRTYRALAELHRERGDEDLAREILQRFVAADELAPPASDLGPELELIDKADFASESVDLFDGDGALDLGLDLGEGEDFLPDDTFDDAVCDPEDELTMVSSRGAERPQAPVAPSGLSAADVEQKMAEVSVYLRYGKCDPAIEHLQEILASVPQHLPALEFLGEAHAENGDSAAAVEAWLRAARVAHDCGEIESLAVLRDRIAALDESAASGLDPLVAAASGEPLDSVEDEYLDTTDSVTGDGSPALEAQESAAPLDLDLGEELALDVDVDIEDDACVDEPAHDDVDLGEDANTFAPARERAVGADSLDMLGGSASTSQRVLEDLEEAEFYLEQGITEEAEGILRRLLRIAPNHPVVLVRLGEIAAARGEDPALKGAQGSEAAPPLQIDEPPGSEFGACEADEALGPEVALPEAALPEVAAPEVEFDEPVSSESEAPTDAVPDGNWRDVTTGEYEIELPSAEPDFELDAVAAALASPTAEEPPNPSDEWILPASGTGGLAEDTFDLAAELCQAIDEDGLGASHDQMGASSDGFSEVFREFKKGVSDSLADGDHETHYDLGIAYREMGLFDDAIQEFRTSMGSSDRQVDALHMIGLCALDMDRPSDAINHFGEALSVPVISDDQQLAIRYELGRAFRSAGDIANARDAFEAVAALDPLFCEVEHELVELEKLKAESRLESVETAVESGYESFDDLISEVSGEPVTTGGTMENFDDLFTDDTEEEEEDPAPSGSGSKDRKRRKISFV